MCQIKENCNLSSLDQHDSEVAEDGVEVHEDVLDHDVDLLAGHVLDQVLVVHPGEHGAADLERKKDSFEIPVLCS